MARPTKQTVDYFPHYVHHGRTLFILEKKFGNDGYSFFYKLLELLADSKGHYYDCRNSTSWEFLLAKTLVSEVSASEILQKLSDIGVSDAEMWNKRIIWVQSFVDSLKDAYRKRSIPDLLQLKSVIFPPESPVEGSFRRNNGQQSSKTGVSSAGNGEKEKEKEIKKEYTSSPGGDSSVDKPTDPCPHQSIIDEYHKLLPTAPHIREWTKQRQALLRSRWKERPERQQISWWIQFFSDVAKSDFLTGKTEKAFVADLEWLIRPKNFPKVIEGRYSNRSAPPANGSGGIPPRKGISMVKLKDGRRITYAAYEDAVSNGTVQRSDMEGVYVSPPEVSHA